MSTYNRINVACQYNYLAFSKNNSHVNIVILHVDIIYLAKRLCFCFLFGGLTFHSIILHSNGNVTITGEGLKFWPILCTHDHWEWMFFSVPQLLWYGLCVLMVISEDPWYSHLLPSVRQWSSHYLFLRLRSVAAEIRTPNLSHATDCTTAAVIYNVKISIWFSFEWQTTCIWHT